MSIPALVAIVGPTASGKSSLGMRVARELSGEIVVCDSTQVYRGFDIGTSKPSEAEQKNVRHHLIDLLEPHELFTAGVYRERAIEVLADLNERKRLPVMTVGTGLYMRALIDGFSDTPVRSEEVRTRLRKSAARYGADYLHRALRRIDSTAAARIGPRDTPKLMRAIEIFHARGETRFRSAKRAPAKAGRISRNKDWINAAAHRALRAHRAAHRRNDGSRLARGSASVGSEGNTRDGETIFVYRIWRIAGASGRKTQTARGCCGNSASHAEIREAASHLVSQRAGREMV